MFNPRTMIKKLVLWDIDGTILLMNEGISDELFENVCEEVYGRTVSLRDYRYGGKTDRGILYEVGELAGLEEAAITDRLDDAMARIVAGLEEKMQPEHVELLPNVRELLDALHARHDVVQGLLTGNLPGCASAKLRPFELEGYFKFGVYGIESRDRNDLGPIALERAIEHLPEPLKQARDVVIIGDSVRDVECAHAIGATCIITLTGRTPCELIEPLGPHYIFEDLRDTEAVLGAILN